jgi:chitin deacetylase
MLYNFLQENNISATHFMIGVQILNFPSNFQFAFDTLGGDIAVHTWTHPYMTTLSNLDVVAQLGWTMQIIHDSTGGRLPQFWRPPYGDSDNRVRAIAQEVFGLKTIYWNQEYVVVIWVVVICAAQIPSLRCDLAPKIGV